MAAGTSVLTLYPTISVPPFRSLSPNRNVTSTISFLANATRRNERNALIQFQIEHTGKNKLQSNSSSVQTIDRVSTIKPEQHIHVVAPLISTLGIIFITILAVYYKFTWQIEEDGNLHYAEMLATLASSITAAVGMEFLSKWVHRVLWHDSLWHIHQSHHRTRKGHFEFNDVFAILNAIPAIALINFGFFHDGLVPGICFGCGVGMTLLGMAYIFVHNGLVHGRFPVGPIANIPYFQKVAAAHQIHHSTKFKGVPYGLFLGPKELEEVGGTAELEKEINRTIRQMKGS